MGEASRRGSREERVQQAVAGGRGRHERPPQAKVDLSKLLTRDLVVHYAHTLKGSRKAEEARHELLDRAADAEELAVLFLLDERNLRGTYRADVLNDVQQWLIDFDAGKVQERHAATPPGDEPM